MKVTDVIEALNLKHDEITEPFDELLVLEDPEGVYFIVTDPSGNEKSHVAQTKKR